MRQEELYETINTALSFALSNLHTSLVCKVTLVNETTISCKPVTNRVVNGESKELPDFIEVPPIFMSGGESYDAMPITVGDYCLLFIAERCFDSWYDGNDFVPPVEMRMHDYSDGFALVGIRNKAGAITIPTVATMQGDREAIGNWDHTGDLERTGTETLTGDRNQTGNQLTDGEITASVLHAGNGFSGTKVADGVSFVFVDGILIS
jgi:hypothetical protein